MPQRDLRGILQDYGQRIGLLERRLPSGNPITRKFTFVPWSADESVAAGATTSSPVDVPGFGLGGVFSVGSSAIVPAGVILSAAYTGDGTARIDVTNTRATTYTIPGNTEFFVYSSRL